MKGLLYILASYLAGEVLSLLIGGFMPGSVLGMLVLFTLLRTKVIHTRQIRLVSRTLLDNMMLFFVPVGVGVVTSYALIRTHIWAIIISLLLSTAIVIAVVGLCQQKLGKR